MKRGMLLIPFLFVLASLLQLHYVALIVVSPDQLIRPLIVLWAVLFCLLWPAYWLTGDWGWASLLLAVLAAGFGFSSSFFSTVLMFMILGGILSVSYLRLRRSRISIVHAAYLLSGVSLFLIAYSIILTLEALSGIPWENYRRVVREAETHSHDLYANSFTKRDIYYIVLDGYARSDILLDLFGFDNSEFVSYLEAQGFVVPRSSVSNYPATHISLASMLNMDYVQSFAPGLEESYNRWLMQPFIDHSRIRTLLEQQGYTTVSISTNWSITDNPSTDSYYRPYPVMLNDFEGFVFDSTPLHLFEPILGTFASVPSPDVHRKIVNYNFDILASLSQDPGPKFVIAHIISPHPPFVFDRNGGPVVSSSSFSFKDGAEFAGSREEYRQKYVNQLEFVNGRLRAIVDAILMGSGTPPVIILQADHGSGMLVDLSSSTNSCMKERFSVFAAYYLPEVNRQVVPSDMSAVNMFRIVLNEYFEADLPMLDSRQYFYDRPASFYSFEDVTARLDDRCEQP